MLKKFEDYVNEGNKEETAAFNRVADFLKNRFGVSKERLENLKKYINDDHREQLIFDILDTYYQKNYNMEEIINSVNRMIKSHIANFKSY